MGRSYQGARHRSDAFFANQRVEVGLVGKGEISDELMFAALFIEYIIQNFHK